MCSWTTVKFSECGGGEQIPGGWCSVPFYPHIYALGEEKKNKNICTPPPLSEVSTASPLKRFADWRWPFSSFEGRSASASPFCPPGDRSCGGAPGFVRAGSVSSSSTLRIFPDPSRHLWWLFSPPVCLLGHISTGSATMKVEVRAVTGPNTGWA